MKRAIVAVVVAGVMAVGVLAVAGVPSTAGAAAVTGCYVGCVTPTSVPVEPPAPAVHAVSVEPPSSSPSSALPFTGADVAELAVIAAVLIVAGWALTRRRRTRT